MYSHDTDALNLKPVVPPKPTGSIRHIDLALRATLISSRLQKDRATHLVYDFPMKNEVYRIWYRIYDDSGNLRSMKDNFKFNIVLDLGFIEDEWTSSQIHTEPINLRRHTIMLLKVMYLKWSLQPSQ